jgi:chromosome segregation ATPase
MSNRTNSFDTDLLALDERVSTVDTPHIIPRKGKSFASDNNQDEEKHTDDELEDINEIYLKNNIMHEVYDFREYVEEVPEGREFGSGGAEGDSIESHPYVISLLKELKSFEDELDLYRKSNELLKRSNEDFKEKLNLLEMEKELAQEEKLACEDEKRDILEKLSASSAYPNSEVIPKLEKQLQELRRDGEERVNSYKNRISKMAEDYSSTLKDREVFEDEKQDLKNQVTKLSLERTELTELNMKLTSEVDRLTVDYKQLEAEHTSLKESTQKKIDELEEEVGQLGDQLASARGHDAEWKIEYERENKILESRLKALGESNRNLEKQKRHLESQRNELQSRKDTLALERDKLVYQLDDITNNIDLTTKKITSAQERLEEKKVQLSTVRSNCSEETSRLLEENEMLKAERDSLESQVKTRECEVESLITQNEEMEQKIAYMGQYLQEMKDVFEEVRELEPKSKDFSDAAKARDILLHLRSERERLKEKNSNLSNEISAANDKIQRLEIQLNEMVELVKKFEESQSKSTNNRNGPVNVNSDNGEKLVHLESEVLELRTRCGSLEAELTAQKDQVSQLDKLRQSFDSTKRQLMDREAEIAELKSKLDLNELEMKSKSLMIGQLQNAYQEIRNRDQSTNLSISTISSGGNSLVVQYEQMIEEMRAKLDQANIENGKLRYQLSEAAQKAIDSVRTATIQKLQLQNAELKRILRSREEDLIKEQNKSFDKQSKSISVRPGEKTRGEIVEGISELMSTSIYSDDKVYIYVISFY